MNIQFQLKQENIPSHTDLLPTFISSSSSSALEYLQVIVPSMCNSLNTRNTFTKTQVKITSYNSEATERAESKSNGALPLGSGGRGWV